METGVGIGELVGVIRRGSQPPSFEQYPLTLRDLEALYREVNAIKEALLLWESKQNTHWSASYDSFEKLSTELKIQLVEAREEMEIYKNDYADRLTEEMLGLKKDITVIDGNVQAISQKTQDRIINLNGKVFEMREMLDGHFKGLEPVKAVFAAEATYLNHLQDRRYNLQNSRKWFKGIRLFFLDRKINQVFRRIGVIQP